MAEVKTKLLNTHPFLVRPGETVVKTVDWKPTRPIRIYGFIPWMGVDKGMEFEGHVVLQHWIGEAFKGTISLGSGLHKEGLGIYDVPRPMNLPSGTYYPVKAGEIVRMEVAAYNSGYASAHAHGVGLIYYEEEPAIVPLFGLAILTGSFIVIAISFASALQKANITF